MTRHEMLEAIKAEQIAYLLEKGDQEGMVTWIPLSWEKELMGATPRGCFGRLEVDRPRCEDYGESMFTFMGKPIVWDTNTATSTMFVVHPKTKEAYEKLLEEDKK